MSGVPSTLAEALAAIPARSSAASLDDLVGDEQEEEGVGEEEEEAVGEAEQEGVEEESSQVCFKGLFQFVFVG